MLSVCSDAFCLQLEQRQDQRHAELLACVSSADARGPDKLQQLDHTDLAAFLQHHRCLAAAAQVRRLHLNGFALAAVVDGLGWATAANGDFLLAKWLAQGLPGDGVVDEMTLLHGACAQLRATVEG